MSPYIVTTKRRSGVAMHCGAMRVLSRHAVATLQEARKLVNDVGYGHVNESGGTVGPLPDGTVIEVQQRSWASLAGERGHICNGKYKSCRTLILDAFNARQVKP